MMIMNDYNYDIRLNKSKYQLFRIIDKEFPFLLIKFYDKYKKILYRFDIEFVRFIFELVTIKSKYNRIFLSIYNVINDEYQNNLKTNMYLN